MTHLEMEEDRKYPKKESSFEIISNSDDDDMATASMYSSLQSSAFESLNSSYFLESLMEEASKDNKLGVKCNTTETQTFRDCRITSFTNGPDATEDEGNTWSSEIIKGTIQDKPNEKIEDYLPRKMLNHFRSNTEDNVSNFDFSTHAIQKPWNSNSEVINLGPGVNSGKLCAVEISENSVNQVLTNRNHSPVDGCSLIKHGLRLCRSLCNNKCLHNLISRAQASIYNLLNSCELAMNLMMGLKDPLKIVITAAVSDSLVIEEAFYQSLSGQVVVSKCPDIKDSDMPILPIGYKSALIVVQSKINKTRLLHTSEKNAVIISTTNFIVEVYPQKWQLCTLLCLEDPNLALSLHNFTTTIPVPNEYMLQAQKLTPDYYPLKDMGLAVTLEQVTGWTTDNMDLEEILCGVPHLVNLKSAAKILAGMYSKYVNRYEQ